MAIEHAGKKFYTTQEACDRIGRSKSAVLRWITLGKIEDVARDEMNNRVWTDEDIERYRKLLTKIRENRKRKDKKRQLQA
jgi:predicted site-specific integrase-resolvase